MPGDDKDPAPRKRQTPWREPRYMLRVLPDPQWRPPSPVEQATDLSEILEGKVPAKKSKRPHEVTDPAPGPSRKKFKKGSVAVLPPRSDPINHALDTFTDVDTANVNEDDLDWDGLLAELAGKITKVPRKRGSRGGRGRRQSGQNNGKEPVRGEPTEPEEADDDNAGEGPSGNGGAGGNDGDDNRRGGGGDRDPSDRVPDDQGPYDPRRTYRLFRWPIGSGGNSHEHWCYCLRKGWDAPESWRRNWDDNTTSDDHSTKAVIKPGVILRVTDMQDHYNQQHRPRGPNERELYNRDKFPTPFGYAHGKLRFVIVLMCFRSSYVGLPVLTYDDYKMVDKYWGGDLINEHVSLRDHRLQYRDPGQHNGKIWPDYMVQQGNREPLVTEYIHGAHKNYIRPTAVVKISAPVHKDINHPAEYIGYISQISLQNLYVYFHDLCCRAGGPPRSITYNPSDYPHPPDTLDDRTLPDPPATYERHRDPRIRRLDPNDAGWTPAPNTRRTRNQVNRALPPLMWGAPQIRDGRSPRPLQ